MRLCNTSFKTAFLIADRVALVFDFAARCGRSFTSVYLYVHISSHANELCDSVRMPCYSICTVLVYACVLAIHVLVLFD